MQSIVSSYHLCLAPPSPVLRQRLLCHRVPSIRLPSHRSTTSLGLFTCAAVSRESEMAAKEDGQDPRIPKIASSIRVIPDFPKPGKGISVVAGVEARGFIFGPPIALAIGAKFVPMRKPKKLPGKVISEEYSLEYGTDKIEMHVGAVEPGERAIIIDDLIATGGTLAAAIRLLERVGVKIVECACVIELPELKGREKLGEAPLFILVTSDAA
ncbi:hypothetical protein HID58_030468 [Brassica napus]|uniref:adenine phosphoribosyltransferase n=1 Tax=Brassica napus TaxID=3708 RepID=A0ABQ8CG06_BRANA|nr:hypothetical protein HID58_030468 [Brassica napus]